VTVVRKFEEEVYPGMVLTAPDNDGVLGFRRVRVLAEHPDGGWLIEDLPSRMRHRPRGVTRCPELNLRIVFEPEVAP
jgi:hypothetical protein